MNNYKKRQESLNFRKLTTSLSKNVPAFNEDNLHTLCYSISKIEMSPSKQSCIRNTQNI